MDNFNKISPDKLDNAMKLIGTDWMLITVRDEKNKRANAMTASWGAMGVLWNKNICICFVRPQRHTHTLLENEDEFSIAFFDGNRRDALRLCGRESGRDTDKLTACGLTVSECDGVPVINEASIVLVCKKLYEDELKECAFVDKALLSNYVSGDYHTFYVCEIKEAYQKGE